MHATEWYLIQTLMSFSFSNPIQVVQQHQEHRCFSLFLPPFDVKVVNICDELQCYYYYTVINSEQQDTKHKLLRFEYHTATEQI